MTTLSQNVSQLLNESGGSSGSQNMLNNLKIKTMKFIGLFMVMTGLWIAFEMYRAPMMDESGRVIKPGKKLRDLWKQKK